MSCRPLDCDRKSLMNQIKVLREENEALKSELRSKQQNNRLDYAKVKFRKFRMFNTMATSIHKGKT